MNVKSVSPGTTARPPAGIAFFVWLLSVFAVKKWLKNKEAHREIADREEILGGA